MAYCTKTDIEKMIPAATVTQLTDDEGTGAKVQERVDEAIAQADAEIDSYCGIKYTVPFAVPVRDVILKCSIDIAIYNLYSRKAEEIPATRSDRYKNAIRLLDGISKGLGSIGETPAPAATTVNTIASSESADDRVFSRGKASKGTVGSLDNY